MFSKWPLDGGRSGASGATAVPRAATAAGARDGVTSSMTALRRRGPTSRAPKANTRLVTETTVRVSIPHRPSGISVDALACQVKHRVQWCCTE